MIRTINLNAEYKSFFSSTDYLTIDPFEISYKVTKITEENLCKETPKQSLVSFEKIRADKMLGMFKYLEFKLPEIIDDYELSKDQFRSDFVIEENKSRKEWFEKNIRFFRRKLSHLDDSTTFITPKHAFFYKLFEKIKYKNDNKVVGRLYNSNSIQTLPREIRYHLFKDDYIDFDMVNSHPSILFDFSKEQNLKLNGSLKDYVNKRSVVFQKIKEEQMKSKFKVLTKSEIKTEILKGLNKEKLSDKNVAETLKNLHLDFEKIREHLFFLYKNDKLDKEFKKALEHSKKKGSTSMKVSLQSFYCQTQESFHIIRFVEFLRNKYSDILKEQKKLKFTDFYPNINKEVEISSIYTLFIVPFFDGVYVSSPEDSFNENLKFFVKEFNDSVKDSSITFEQKIIEKRVKQIDDNELTKFLIINGWLSKRTSKRLFNVYLKHLNFTENYLTGLQNLDIEQKEYKTCEYQWEIDYENLIDDLKTAVFKDLLSKGFKTELEIEIYIQSLV